MATRRSVDDSFTAAEKRIAITRRRLPQFSADRVAALRLITHLYKRGQAISNTVLKPYGLNMATYGALMMLVGTDDSRLSVSQLADAAGEKRANMTRICDELLEKGLIERSASLDDRRSIMVVLSRKGQKLIETLLPAMNGMLAYVDDDCGPGELRDLIRLLRRLLVRMDRSVAAEASEA